MPSSVDTTKPADNQPAVKNEIRSNWTIIRTEVNHGGFAVGLTPANYATANDQVISHLTGIDAALGAGGGGGSSTFVGLSDTPAAYTFEANKFIRVNATENALEFADVPGGGDMLKSAYDPTNVNKDAFVRANHTGEMPLAGLAPATVERRVLGRAVGAGAGDWTALDETAVRTIIGNFAVGNRGLVPDPGSSTGRFLRDDATWAAPSGGTGGTSFTVAEDTNDYGGANPAFAVASGGAAQDESRRFSGAQGAGPQIDFVRANVSPGDFGYFVLATGSNFILHPDTNVQLNGGTADITAFDGGVVSWWAQNDTGTTLEVFVTGAINEPVVLDEIAEPLAPAADQTALYLDSADGVLKVKKPGGAVVSLEGGGVTTFAGLSDTPASLTGAGNQFVKVNAGATALEFAAGAGLQNIVEDTTPELGGTLDGNGNAIIDYSQPHVANVSGTLTQASHGGRAILITGTVTVPVTNGFTCLVRNKSGNDRTVQPASGNLIHEGTIKASISLPTNRAVSVHGDGSDVWVAGALA